MRTKLREQLRRQKSRHRSFWWPLWSNIQVPMTVGQRVASRVNIQETLKAAWEQERVRDTGTIIVSRAFYEAIIQGETNDQAND